MLDRNSRMLRIEAHVNNPVLDLTSDKEITLTPGMFGTATVAVRHWESLAVVPTQAIARDASGSPYVMVAEGGKAHRRNVGIVFNDAVDVGVTGVAGGDRVVVSEVSGLKDGQEIPLESASE